MSDRVPPGLYAGGFTWVRKRGAGGFMLNIRCEIIGIIDGTNAVRPEMAGRSFFFSMSTRLERSFNQQRWYEFARATGQKELHQNKRQEDFSGECIARNIIGAACILQVVTARRGEYINHEVKRFIAPQNPRQTQALEQWRQSFVDRQEDEAEYGY